MIKKQFRSDAHALKLAFIEACLDTKGFYNNFDMSNVFGNHEKDAARIVKRYKELNPDTIVKQGRELIPTSKYKRKFLKTSTNAWEYITMLELLHGSKISNDS